MRDDPYLEGFAEGRRSMARSIAVKLAGTMSDEEIASLVGLAPDELAALLAPPTPRPEEEAAKKAAPAPHAVVRGLSLVEPVFVRTVRAARGFTQPELARILGVHPDTVSEWESSPGPVRIREASYKKLAALAAKNAK
jgi:DNA-binding transcriptional regulator YiaG